MSVMVAMTSEPKLWVEWSGIGYSCVNDSHDAIPPHLLPNQKLASNCLPSTQKLGVILNT